MTMASVATMGPPPSPKEPRRSGRRPAPSASTSKSPAGSPATETAPKLKENSHRPTVPSSNNSNRSKRAKQEDHDEVLEETHKNGVNGSTNGRTKRKNGSKDKEKASLTVEIPVNDIALKAELSAGDVTLDPPEEEEQGITRCICGGTGAEDDSEAGEYMAECDICHTWQHCKCMGYNVNAMPKEYFCEQCRPDLYVDLLKKHAKRVRQSSAASHHTSNGAANPSRSSRSHSPTQHSKPTKRRNTMNSRDAAYDETLQDLIETTAAEAAAANEANSPKATSGGGDCSANGHVEPERDPDPVSNNNNRKKRKRVDDDAASTKRTRSASIVSERPATNHAARDATPASAISAKAPPLVPPPASKARSKRSGGRKSQVQDLASVDGEEAAASTSSTRRQANTSRSKANASNEHASRRNQANGVNGHGPTSTAHPSTSSSSRAYRESHAYAVSQQPLFTSWNLPDYLAHLEPMLPTDVPRPLEVRGSGMSNGRESAERTTERGVKVKWPSKRMSVGDMNKRVRALVEWVGREQASATERSRRREALEKALKEALAPNGDSARCPGEHASGGATTMILDGGPVTESPGQEKRMPLTNGSTSSFIPDALGSGPGSATMKMMEELMEELISFQERFGPGVKLKERERRTAS